MSGSQFSAIFVLSAALSASPAMAQQSKKEHHSVVDSVRTLDLKIQGAVGTLTEKWADITQKMPLKFGALEVDAASGALQIASRPPSSLETLFHKKEEIPFQNGFVAYPKLTCRQESCKLGLTLRYSNEF